MGEAGDVEVDLIAGTERTETDGVLLAGVEQAQMGFTTLVTLVLFLGGVQMISIGILGEYIGRIYEEIKQRPLYIVSGKVGLDDKSAGG